MALDTTDPSHTPSGTMASAQPDKPESFYEEYTVLVWATIGIITSLTIIIALLAVNITQRRNWARELADKARELERTNAELQEFSTIAYHDMQEPLRIIGGFVQLLEKRYHGRLDKDADEFIDLTVQNVNHMKQLFADLLNYLSLSRDRMHCDRHDGNVILSAVLSGLKARIDDCGAVVTHDQLPVIHGDRAMLTLLLHNLLTNTLKFRGEEAPRVHIASWKEKDRIVISVSDNGIGIASEYRERVFQIFKKLHNRSEYPGTGIGLSICKRVAELHDGHIWFDSEPGTGSRFYFSLPAKYAG
jgi:light-regulated signal transduction histidine kinase (bacteriophytochrome)